MPVHLRFAPHVSLAGRPLQRRGRTILALLPGPSSRGQDSLEGRVGNFSSPHVASALVRSAAIDFYEMFQSRRARARADPRALSVVSLCPFKKTLLLPSCMTLPKRWRRPTDVPRSIADGPAVWGSSLGLC